MPLAAPNTPAAAAAAPVPITAIPRGIHSALISPDGRRYAILADPRLPDPLDDIHTVVENDADEPLRRQRGRLRRRMVVSHIERHRRRRHCVVSGRKFPGDSVADAENRLPLCPLGYRHLQRLGITHVATIDNAASNVGWINGGKDLVFLSTTTTVLTPDHVWTVPAVAALLQDRTPTLSGTATHLYGDPHGNIWVTVARGVQDEIDSFQDGKLTTAYKWPGGTVDCPDDHAATGVRTGCAGSHRQHAATDCQYLCSQAEVNCRRSRMRATTRWPRSLWAK